MSELTVELIRRYAKNIDKSRPEFPDKQDKLLLIEKSKIGIISITDVETTDIEIPEVEITEIAVQQYFYDRDTFELLGLGKSYSSLNEPSDLSKITPKITELTGIKQKDVIGHKANWEEVASLFNESDYIVAHNAKFDKEHILKKVNSITKWLCSFLGVDWTTKGAPNKKLEILCLHFGEFTYSGHRAIEDVLSTGLLIEKAQVFKEMVDSASLVSCKVEGFLDAYGKTTVKDIITKKDNELGVVFRFQSEFNSTLNKKDYWYEARNLTMAEFNELKKNLTSLVQTHNSKGLDKLKITAIEQSY